MTGAVWESKKIARRAVYAQNNHLFLITFHLYIPDVLFCRYITCNHLNIVIILIAQYLLVF